MGRKVVELRYLERMGIRESATEESLSHFVLFLATFMVPLKYFPSQRFNGSPDARSLMTILPWQNSSKILLSIKIYVCDANCVFRLLYANGNLSGNIQVPNDAVWVPDTETLIDSKVVQALFLERKIIRERASVETLNRYEAKVVKR